MRLLALDLGTKTGWALFDNGVIKSGTWILATDKEIKAQKAANLHRCCDCRAARLFKHIEDAGPVDHIFFEDVQFASSQLQAQLWGGLRGIVTLFYPRYKICAVPVGTLKKFATGQGNATKELMAATLEAKTAFPPAGRDDNEIDALHLLQKARHDLKV